MGGLASTQRSHGRKDADDAVTQSREATLAASPAAEDATMDDTAEASEDLDAVGPEPQLGSLRVKDPDAWKGSGGPRPRSALKHGSSSASIAESDASGGVIERTPSGRRMPRKVSFQVHGLSAPEAVTGCCHPDGDGEQASKRVRGSEEFSMKFLVEKFYGKVLAHKELQPFFDGVDMLKLKHQQEALMLLVFGGQELLEDELPGLAADLRLIHLHLLFEGLNLHHWQLFADTFSETLDELHQIPDEVKHRAKAYMTTTKHHFRPIEPHEWPPKVVYKGWTKRSCPFHTSFKRPTDPSVHSRDGGDSAAADGAADGAVAAALAEDDGGAGASGAEDDSLDFILPGINSPPLGVATAAATATVPPAGAVTTATAEPATALPESSGEPRCD